MAGGFLTCNQPLLGSLTGFAAVAVMQCHPQACWLNVGSSNSVPSAYHRWESSNSFSSVSVTASGHGELTIPQCALSQHVASAMVDMLCAVQGSTVRLFLLWPCLFIWQFCLLPSCLAELDWVCCRPTGAVRVSFGWTSTFSDASAVVRLLQQYLLVPKAQAPLTPAQVSEPATSSTLIHPGADAGTVPVHSSGAGVAVGASSKPALSGPAAAAVTAGTGSNRLAGFAGWVKAAAGAAAALVRGLSQPPELAAPPSSGAAAEQVAAAVSLQPPGSSAARAAGGAGPSGLDQQPPRRDAAAGMAECWGPRSSLGQHSCWLRIGDSVRGIPTPDALPAATAAPTSADTGAASRTPQQAAALQSGQLQLPAGSQLLSPGSGPHADAHALPLQQSQESGAAAGVLGSLSAEPTPPGPPPQPSQGARQGQAAPGKGSQARPGGVGHVLALWLYPIKSCAALAVTEWPLGPNGLLLDREWALVDERGHVSFSLLLDVVHMHEQVLEGLKQDGTCSLICCVALLQLARQGAVIDKGSRWF